MSRSVPPKAPLFRCRRARVFYTYSFTLTKGGGIIQEPCKILNGDQGASGTPPSRQGIAPHLELKDNSGWKALPPVIGAFQHGGGKWPATLSGLQRLFQIGGTCTFELDVRSEGKPLFTPTLLALLSLTKTRSGKPDNIADGLLSLPDESGPLTSLYPRFAQTMGALTNDASVEWEDKKFLAEEDEPQSPWIVTVAEVDGPVASAFCDPAGPSRQPANEKALRRRRFENEVAQMVFRSISDQLPLEPAYLQPPFVGAISGLYSLNLDARLFVSLSRRAVLCVCRDSQKDPGAYFLPGLLDICELVRARWHALVILHKLLDQTIEAIVLREGTRQDRQTRIMEMRQRLATCLIDPTLYIVAGDALSKIYSDLRAIFRLEDLKGTLLSKMDIADRVHSDVQELEWMKQRGLEGS